MVQLIEKHSEAGSWKVTRCCRLHAKSQGRMNRTKVYSLILWVVAPSRAPLELFVIWMQFIAWSAISNWP